MIHAVLLNIKYLTSIIFLNEQTLLIVFKECWDKKFLKISTMQTECDIKNIKYLTFSTHADLMPTTNSLSSSKPNQPR
jgi:hypothetical protein